MGVQILTSTGLFLAVLMIFLAVFLGIFILGLLLALRGGSRSRRRRGADIPRIPELFDASRNSETNPPDQQQHSADSSAHQPHHSHQHQHDHHQMPSVPDTTAHHQMPSMPDLSSHHHTGGFDAGASHSGGSHHSH